MVHFNWRFYRERSLLEQSETCDLIFCDFQLYLPYRIWPFSWLPMVRPLSSGQYFGGLLFSSCQQAVRNTVWTFPQPVHLERVCWPSAWPTCNGARLNVALRQDFFLIWVCKNLLLLCCSVVTLSVAKTSPRFIRFDISFDRERWRIGRRLLRRRHLII